MCYKHLSMIVGAELYFYKTLISVLVFYNLLVHNCAKFAEKQQLLNVENSCLMNLFETIVKCK